MGFHSFTHKKWCFKKIFSLKYYATGMYLFEFSNFKLLYRLSFLPELQSIRKCKTLNFVFKIILVRTSATTVQLKTHMCITIGCLVCLPILFQMFSTHEMAVSNLRLSNSSCYPSLMHKICVSFLQTWEKGGYYNRKLLFFKGSLDSVEFCFPYKLYFLSIQVNFDEFKCF